MRSRLSYETWMVLPSVIVWGASVKGVDGVTGASQGGRGKGRNCVALPLGEP